MTDTCKARMSIADRYGDNSSIMRCQLPMGHEGLHQESFDSCNSGSCTVQWEKNDIDLDVEDLMADLERLVSDRIPRVCWTADWDEEVDDSYMVAEMYGPGDRIARVSYMIDSTQEPLTICFRHGGPRLSLNEAAEEIIKRLVSG